MKRILFIVLLLNLLIAGSALAQATTPEPAADWQQIPLDGAICARGTPYSFFVHDGSPDKLMVYFQGGGACWNADTCKPGGTFDDSVGAHELDIYRGIFDLANPQNPVADYTIVVVTYCTGDVHIGSSTQTFDSGGTNLTIHFDGFANAQAVLQWTYAHYPHPSHLIVTGSSAGAYGAIFNAPFVLAHYPAARAVIFGDAGVGVVAPKWDGFSTWNTANNVYTGGTYGSIAPGANFTNELYTSAAQTFPNAQIAEYTSAVDSTQTGFYVLQGGMFQNWSVGMQANIAALDRLANFHSYVGWGGIHTILPRALFYTMQVNGVPFRDWFANLIGDSPGEQPITDVQCKDCQKPELVGQ